MLPNDTLDQPVADTQDQTATPAAPVASTVPLTVKEVAPNTVQNWYDGFSPDVKNNPTVQKYKTAEDQVKAHLELQTLLGHTKVALPKDEKDALAIKNFNKAIGVPDEPNGYQLEEPELPVGFEKMAFGTDQFKGIVHKHGLTPKQAQGLMNDYIGMLGEIKANSERDFQASLEATKSELSKEWGLAFDGKVRLAQTVMNKFAGDKETFDYINAKVGGDAMVLKMLAKIGENFKEGSLGDLGSLQSQFTKTPSEAKAEYDKIMNDKNDIYWAGVQNNTYVPESVRKERISYVESLLKMQAGHAR